MSVKRTPKLRMHNPNGGGFKPNQQTHKLSKDKKSENIEDKIVRTGKMTLNDLKKLVDDLA